MGSSPTSWPPTGWSTPSTPSSKPPPASKISFFHPEMSISIHQSDWCKAGAILEYRLLSTVNPSSPATLYVFGTVKAETYLYHFSSLALDSRCHFSKNYPTVWRIPVHKLLSRQPRKLRLLLYDHHVTMR